MDLCNVPQTSTSFISCDTPRTTKYERCSTSYCTYILDIFLPNRITFWPLAERKKGLGERIAPRPNLESFRLRLRANMGLGCLSGIARLQITVDIYPTSGIHMRTIERAFT